MVGKRGGEKKGKKKIERQKIILVLFVCSHCLMQSVKLWKFVEKKSTIFFYHKWFVYISIAHTIHICLHFFITLFKFCKSVQRDMHKLWPFFFLLVDINLNHNVNFYFLDYFSLLMIFFFFFWVNFVLVVNVFLALYWDILIKKIVNYIIYPNNILFNKNNAFSKIPIKHNSF